MTEEWRDVVGYEGLYQVSNLGNVKSLDRLVICEDGFIRRMKGGLLKQQINRGYMNVRLYKNGVGKTVKVHRAVAMAFIDNNEKKPTVNHKDGNKTNNCVDNLEWFTHKEQTRHAIETGLKKRNYRFEEIKDEFIEKYSNGSSVSELSRFYNTTAKTVSSLLKRNGIKVKTSDELETKPVICRTVEGVFVCEFKSVGDASRWLCKKTNTNYKMHKGIKRCCVGETKTCKGYIWEYK